MCHHSVGVLQNALEQGGLTTISVTVRPDISEGVGVVRAVHHRFPLGYPLGEAGKPEQQRIVVRNLLGAVPRFTEPGTIIEAPFRWRRMGKESV